MLNVVIIVLTAVLSIGITAPFITFETNYSRTLAAALSQSFQCSNEVTPQQWILLTNQDALFRANPAVFLSQYERPPLKAQRCNFHPSRSCMAHYLNVISNNGMFFKKYVSGICKNYEFDKPAVKKRAKAEEKKAGLFFDEVNWRLGLIRGYYTVRMSETELASRDPIKE